MRWSAGLEPLEDRILLNANLTYDSAGALVFESAPNAGDVVDFSAETGVTTISDTGNAITVALAAGPGVVEGSGSHVVTITGSVASVTLDGNGPGATFHVLSTSVPTTVTNSQGSLSVPDTVVVGTSANAPTPGGVQGIDGALSITNVGGLTDLTIDDSADVTGQSAVTLTDHDVSGLAPAAIAFAPTVLGALTVLGGAGGNTFTIAGTVPGVTTDLDAGAGNDTVNVLALEHTSVLNINTQTGTDAVAVMSQSDPGGIDGTLNLSSAGNLGLTVSDPGGGQGLLANVVAGVTTLSGLAGGGTIRSALGTIDALTIDDPQVTVDFSGGNPLPSGAGSAQTTIMDPAWYDGNYGTVNLRGTPPAGPFQDETMSEGSVSFAGGTPGFSMSFFDNYAGAPAGYPVLNDTVSAVDCSFTALGYLYATSGVVDGPIVDGVQTAAISRSTAPLRVIATVNVANKTNLSVSTRSPTDEQPLYQNETSVDMPAAAAGLASLVVDSGGGPFSTNVIAIPPGVFFQASSNPFSPSDTQSFDATAAGIPVGATAVLSNVLDQAESNPVNSFAAVLDYVTTGVTATETADSPGGPNGANGILISSPGSGSVDAGGFSQINVTHADPFPVVPVSGSLPDINEGQPLSNVVIASFTCAEPGVSASDFTATIDAYGLYSAPIDIVPDANDPNLFHVIGSLVFDEEGAYTVGVTIQHKDPTPNTSINGTLITSQFAAVQVSIPINVATQSLTLSVMPLPGVEGTTRYDVPIATFSAGIDFSISDLSVATGSQGGYVGGQPYIEQTQNSKVYTILAPSLFFASPGRFVLSVSVTDADFTSSGLTKAVYSGSAPLVVNDAPLTSSGGPIVKTTEGSAFQGVVASFRDAGENPGGALLAAYWVTIDWGDGSPQDHTAMISPGPSGSAPFVVTGEHIYADAGTNGGVGHFTITTTIVDPVGGAKVEATTQALVTDVPITLAGKLDPASDTGMSQTDGITNDAQPRFVGTTEPLATVRLYVVPVGTNLETLVGTVTADAQGAWSIIPTVPLADGNDTVLAWATDNAGKSTAMTQLLPNAQHGPLVIDTTGPCVTRASYNRVLGTLNIGITDAGAGLNLAALANVAFYGLARPTARPVFARPNAVAVAPGSGPNSQTATVTIPVGRAFRRAPILVLLRSAGVVDVAGNPLNGSFHGRLTPFGPRFGGDFLALVGPAGATAHAPIAAVSSRVPSAFERLGVHRE